MIVGILGIIIGMLVTVTGIYYLRTDKEEGSKKVYGIISAIGAVAVVISAVILFLNI